jgi:hypothetical protein
VFLARHPRRLLCMAFCKTQIAPKRCGMLPTMLQTPLDPLFSPPIIFEFEIDFIM